MLGKDDRLSTETLREDFVSVSTSYTDLLLFRTGYTSILERATNEKWHEDDIVEALEASYAKGHKYSVLVNSAQFVICLCAGIAMFAPIAFVGIGHLAWTVMNDKQIKTPRKRAIAHTKGHLSLS